MKNSFVSGALILMAANAVSKILGAALKIPLTYIMREEGMAIYNTAFSVYVMFLTFTAAGIPFAVQKLTAAAHAAGNGRKAQTVVFCATLILCAAGAAGGAIMWVGADFLAAAMRDPKAAHAIRAAAPSVFLVAAGTAVKSGFQGAGNMIPTAVSQVVESFIKLGAGFAFARLFIAYGTEFAAAGAVAGVTAGELAATAMLVIMYLLSFRTRAIRHGFRAAAQEIGEIALPLFFTAAVCSALSVCDASLLRRSLLIAGLSADEARFAYGAYTGYAATVLNLPAGLLATLSVSIVPIISGADAAGNTERILKMTRRAIAAAALCGTVAAAGTALFSNQILLILFRNAASAPLLRLAAPSILFICLMQVTGAILQSSGCIWQSFAASAAASVTKILFSVFAVSRPEINIYGAALGTDTAFLVGTAINCVFLYFALRRRNGILRQ